MLPGFQDQADRPWTTPALSLTVAKALEPSRLSLACATNETMGGLYSLEDREGGERAFRQGSVEVESGGTLVEGKMMHELAKMVSRKFLGRVKMEVLVL